MNVSDRESTAYFSAKESPATSSAARGFVFVGTFLGGVRRAVSLLVSSINCWNATATCQAARGNGGCLGLAEIWPQRNCDRSQAYPDENVSQFCSPLAATFVSSLYRPRNCRDYIQRTSFQPNVPP